MWVFSGGGHKKRHRTKSKNLLIVVLWPEQLLFHADQPFVGHTVGQLRCHGNLICNRERTMWTWVEAFVKSWASRRGTWCPPGHLGVGCMRACTTGGRLSLINMPAPMKVTVSADRDWSCVSCVSWSCAPLSPVAALARNIQFACAPGVWRIFLAITWVNCTANPLPSEIPTQRTWDKRTPKRLQGDFQQNIFQKKLDAALLSSVVSSGQGFEDHQRETNKFKCFDFVFEFQAK